MPVAETRGGENASLFLSHKDNNNRKRGNKGAQKKLYYNRNCNTKHFSITMVRGNWQKRVELADARRKEAKQRKQKNEDRKQSKLWVQDLFKLLDKHANLLSGRQIHLWTDTMPSDGPPLLDLLDDEYPSSKRRSRGNSITESDVTRKGRSNSVTEHKPKKKVHPRSREAEQDNGDDAVELPLLCRSHFLFGKCEEASSGRKKGTTNNNYCRHFHYPNHYKTLGQVLNTKETRSNQQELIACDASLEEPFETETNTMDMIYYVLIEFNTDGICSDWISKSLSEKKIVLSDIVYVAVNGILLFDRNREGLVVSDETDWTSGIGGNAFKSPRKSSVGTEATFCFSTLPGAILELMLTFLPDNAVAACSQVCKGWYHEIGQNSPQLWRHLLERRNWPMPSFDVPSTISQQQRFRDAFLAHYTAIRDARAIQIGLNVLDGSKRVSGSREMAFHDFSTRKFAPAENSYCMSVHAWDENRVLASYDRDCSLRLFESRISENNEDMVCKELICQSVDPYRNTKKRKCRLLAADLDEECIASLCIVSTDHVSVHAYILVIINRDDFLLGESSFASVEGGGGSDALLNVIDIGEAVLNYMFNVGYSNPETVQILTALVEFLQDGGEVGQVDVAVSHSFVACGYGRFMLEVCIAIPGNDGDSLQVGRKLVLFSASVGTIVWVGECPAYDNLLLPLGQSVTFSSIRRRHATGSRRACTVAVTPNSLPGQIVLIDIEPAGEVLQPQVFECPEATQLLLREGEWEMGRPFRSIVLTSTKVIVVENLLSANQGANRRNQIQVTIFHRVPSTAPTHTFTLNDMIAVQSTCVRDEYFFVLYADRLEGNDEENDAEALDGQWFEAGPRGPPCMWVAIFHIPTFCEIGRQLWQRNTHPFNEDLRSIVMTHDGNETLGVGLSWKGIIMTGDYVRAAKYQRAVIINDSGDRSGKNKKKKKPVKSAKKDGYARGMSLRG